MCNAAHGDGAVEDCAIDTLTNLLKLLTVKKAKASDGQNFFK